MHLQSSFGQLNAAFTASNTNGCTPLFVQFTDASTGNPSQWKWDLGNGAISTQQNPGAVYINPGTYTIRLLVTNGSGKDSVIKQNYITVYAKPNVQFSASPTSGCLPLNVQFTDQSTSGSGNITTEIWDFGDGQIANGSNPAHTYTVSDTFGVTLSVTNNFGCTQTLQQPKLIQIAPAVLADFDYSYTNACQPPTKVNFNNLTTSKSPLTYEWIFGDGGSATQTNPVYTYNQNGNYTVQLVAKSDQGCADTVSKSLSVGAVIPDFVLPDGACVNEPLLFSNASSPSPSSASWTFGDGGTSTKINPFHTYTVSGTYQIKMTANFGSCVSTATKDITVLGKPVAGFTTSGIVATCTVPATVQFNNTSTGAVSFKWLFGDGTSSTDGNPSHTFIKQGYFDITLIAFNSNGCSDTITENNLIKLGPPKITGFEGLPFAGCAPQTITLKADIVSGASIVSYNWDFGDGTTSTDSTPVHQFTKVGSYNVRLVAISSGGCTDTLYMRNAVELGVKPHADFTANLLNVCSNQDVQFTDLSTGNVSSWEWNLGYDGFSSLQNPQYTFGDTGYLPVTLIVSNNGCSDTLTKLKYIYVNPPVAYFNATLKCKNPFTRNFTSTSLGAITWSWDFGDGITSNDSTATHTYTTQGEYYVKLTTTNNACKSVAVDTIFILDEHPSFTYNPAKTTLCKYDSVSFSASNYTPENIKNFCWDFGDGSTSGFALQNATKTHVYTSAGTYIPSLITTDINGCKDTATDNLLKFMVYGPTASFSILGGTCIHGTEFFRDHSTSDGTFPITKWTWDYGDGTTQTLAAPPFQHTYDSAGNFTVKLAVYDSNGCMDSLVKKGVQITQPLADFSISDSVRCAKSAVSFQNLSSGLSLTYQWDFGNGQTSTVLNPQIGYKTEGVYSIKLSVTDQFGCQDSITKTNLITISNPKSSFILKDTFASCPPLIIQPQSTSQNFTSLLWNFADGNSTNIPDPTHYYTVAGIYNLQLIAKGYGNCYDTSTKKIILKGPSGTLHYSTFNGCAPTNISFSATTKNVAGYIWDFNNGVTENTTDSLINYTYDTYGSYLPKLILIDSSGCKVSVVNTDTIVIADVKANLNFLSSINCDSTLISFKDSSGAHNDNINMHAWNFGDGSSSTVINPSHYYSSSGNYNARLIVGTTNGCKDTVIVPVNVTVHKSPEIVIDAPDSSCINSSVQLNANDKTNDSSSVVWQWDLGNNQTANAQNTAYTYSVSGLYHTSIKATDQYGCADSAKHTITIVAAPNLNAGSDTTICKGNIVTLKASGANTYLWNSDPSLSCINCASPLARPDTTTTYYLNGSITFGCAANDSVTIKVAQPVKITVSAADTLCNGETVKLQASGADKYQWYPSSFLDNPKSDQPVFNASVDTSIVYTVIGTDNNNCFADTGKVNVKVYPVPQTQILDHNITLNVGSSVQLKVQSSPDVTQWRWTPPDGLDNAASESPVAAPKATTTYTCVATNGGSCTSRDQVTVTVLCNSSNIFVPNTFSPNNDGMNDWFYPRGNGLFSIKSMMIFNRWGQMVFQKTNFGANNPNVGWDGTFQGKKMPSDVYVYVMQVLCENNALYVVKGDITLIR